MPVSLVEAAEYPKNINFQHILETHDVTLGEVRSIIQNRQGFLWFGGETALMRYDGYSLKKIPLILSGSKGVIETKSVSMVNHLHEGSTGIIWVASGDGVLQYDPMLDKLTRLPDHSSLKELPLSTVEAHDIVELPRGRLAIATGRGLYLVNSSTGEGARIRASAGNVLSHDSVNALLVSSSVLWIGTQNGLDRLDLLSGEFTHFKPYSPKPQSASDNGVFAIEQGTGKRLWLGTNRGLIDFDPSTLDFTRYEKGKRNESQLRGDDIWDLFLDSKGDLWVATDGGGLSVFNPTKKTFTSFESEGSRSASISSDVIRTVMEDLNGDIWVGIYPSGVDFFDYSSLAIEVYKGQGLSSKSIFSSSVMSFSEDEFDNLWIANGGGLDYFNRSEGKFTHHPSSLGRTQDISSIATLSLVLDEHKRLWGGTWGGGVYVYNTLSKDIKYLPSDTKRVVPGRSYSESLNNNKVWSILPGREQDYWIATHEGGLSRYVESSGVFTHYTYDESDKNSISSNLVWSVFIDSVDDLWVGTSVGLCLFDKESGSFTRIQEGQSELSALSMNDVFSIAEDKEGSLWLGTAKGLIKYSRANSTFTRYGLEIGFVNDSIRSLVVDTAGSIWMGTSNGVTVLDSKTLKVKNFNREGGKLVGGFNFNSAILSSKGEVIMGGVNGLRIFTANKITDNEVVPNVVFTDFKVDSESVSVNGINSILSKEINHTKKIILDHKKSTFEFEFSALNFRDNEKNQYEYQLLGFDTHWVKSSGHRRARYTNLDPGLYTFRVKGSNNHGYWNQKGAKVVVQILSPWWQSWWAYSVYGVIFLVLVYWALHTYRTKNAYEKEKLLRRTEQLLKDQEIQAEKMAGLSSLVAGMAHEFNNPLNFFKAGSYNVEMDVHDIQVQVEDLLLELKDFENSHGEYDGLIQEVSDEFKGKFASVFASLSSMSDGTDRIRNLVEDLHAFSRIGMGGKDIIRVSSLLDKCQKWVEDNYGDTVACHFNCGDEYTISCSETSIHQALINIVENGCQSIKSSLSAQASTSRGLLEFVVVASEDFVKISILDSGGGMSEKDLKHLFEPFYTGKPIGEGTGLGMAIAFSAIDGDGGTISAESRPGSGAAVIIKLPRA